MTRIHFHIGAHKTATTHLQMSLAQCRFTPGTRYVPLKTLRRTLISLVRKQRPRIPWHRWYGGTWLFSDENILGTTANALLMYPEPAQALRYFLDCELSVFLCVRRYDTFLTSAYGERLWRHSYQPFETKLPQRRWPDIVADLQRELPATPIHVWCYEDYRNNAKQVAQFYADGTIIDFGKPLRTDPKSGFSSRAIEEIAGLNPALSPTLSRKSQLRKLRDRFPVSSNYPRFDPWSKAQKEQLQAMYTEDLEKIAEMTHLWRPT